MGIEKESVPVIFLGGWYQEEHDGHFPFRWMQKKASCSFPHGEEGEEHILKIRGGHHFPGSTNPILSIFINDREIDLIEILPIEKDYFVPLGKLQKDGKIIFKLNKTFDYTETQDQRDLGILVRTIELLTLKEGAYILGEGWHDLEFDDIYYFRWTDKRARIFLSPQVINEFKFFRFYADSLFSGFEQKLSVTLDGKAWEAIPLLEKWSLYSLAFEKISINTEAGNQRNYHELILSVNKSQTEKHHPSNPRELGVKIRDLEFHNDQDEHENLLYFLHNSLLNYQEMCEGKVVLTSYPPNLGIDIYGKCNIKPPCVYCEWDWMKEAEGDNVNTLVDEKTLEGYNSFFRSARTLINCSIGEPLLNPRLDEILKLTENHHKILEMATNGQSLTSKTTELLLGKNIRLYVSLDAACKETYAKIRNDRWDSIIPNIIKLGQERKKTNNLPIIFMVFMPMRVNRNDLEDYFRLCQKIEADSLILRPLNFLSNTNIEIERAGYTYNYQNELLTQAELKEVFLECEEFSQTYGVRVGSQFEFGLNEKNKQQPTNTGK